MSRRAARSPLLIAALLLAPSFASANGNVSHQWVTQAAAEQTPAEGSLRDLVGDEALREILHTGTMYPDWGYTPGASTEEREAGESSHWEPVQDGYRQWIMENYAPPWSDEARQHLAFYLGLSSHGMVQRRAECTRAGADCAVHSAKCDEAQVVQQEARLEFGTESSLDDTPAAKLENELGGDLFVLAIRCRCLR